MTSKLMGAYELYAANYNKLVRLLRKAGIDHKLLVNVVSAHADMLNAGEYAAYLAAADVEQLLLMFSKRIDQIDENLILRDAEHTANIDKYHDIYIDIKNALPDESIKELMELDTLSSLCNARAQELMYIQGVKDGIALAK